MFGQPKIVIPPVEKTEKWGLLNKASLAPSKGQLTMKKSE